MEASFTMSVFVYSLFFDSSIILEQLFKYHMSKINDTSHVIFTVVIYLILRGYFKDKLNSFHLKYKDEKPTLKKIKGLAIFFFMWIVILFPIIYRMILEQYKIGFK